MSVYSSHPCFHLPCTLFCIWAQSRVSLSLMLVCCQVCLNSCVQEWSLLCFEEVVLENQPALTGCPFICHGDFPWDSTKMIPEWAEICSAEVPCVTACTRSCSVRCTTCLYRYLRSLNSTVSWLLWSRLFLTSTWLSGSSLFVSNRSSWAS